ncbi:YejG family protein [Proteus myxofaciens]|uniref:Uncharacterized protein n=1 Tax=Proteus myxofaciens ATCC 19692 TaxID=1354337 RepID=A0A198FDW6_9GAMM|nr:YejG family protein [Proteus myxofaciens]OAT22594.1 hypothetical protein M983_2908 [Proteus myxofaciens ATCC 19692]
MDNVQLSVVHKLPLSYRWLAGFTGTKVEILPENEAGKQNTLIGLKLLSHDGMSLNEAIENLRRYLSNLNIEGNIIEWDGTPCLFLLSDDESAALCCLKNAGVAIAEPFPSHYSYL